MVKLFIVLLFICIIIKSTISQELESSQYDCFLNIKNKFNLDIQTLSNGRFDFCHYSSCNQYGSILNFILFSTSIGVDPTSVQLKPEDLACFPNMTQTSINGINLAPNFYSYPFPKLTVSIHNDVFGFGGLSEANKPINQFERFYLISTELDGSTINFSWFNNCTFLTLGKGYVNFIIDSSSNNKVMGVLSLYLLSFPDFTYFKKDSSIKIVFDSRLNVNSVISNFKTIQNNSIQSTIDIDFGFGVTSTTKIQLNVFSTNLNLNGEVIIRNPNLIVPTSIIDFSAVKFRIIGFINPGTSIHVNGKLPIKINPISGVRWDTGGLTVLPSFTDIGNYIAWLPNNKIVATLPTFPYSTSSLAVVNFGSNNLTGTIDNSWCKTELVVQDNQLTGTVPTCFTCYFGAPSYDENRPAMTSRFTGNSFTNIDPPPPCTTFAPQFSVKTNSSLLYTGIDIGYDPSNFIRFNVSFKSSLDITSPRIPGIQYTLNMNKAFSLYDISYLNATFEYPGVTYTFGLKPIPPSPSNVIISSTTQLSISGTFFSSYYGQAIQSVTIGGSNCVISSLTQQSFFSFICTTSTQLPKTDTKQLLSITTGTLNRKVYIKTTNTSVENNLVCPGYCTGSNGICDLTTGICECQGRFIFDDCSGISCLTTCPGHSSCNNKIGECVCDNGWQGSGCDVPFIQCPSVNGNLCNSAGPCNNVTGECSCTDGNHQGFDCSLPFIQCPLVNGNLCNLAGPCNNQTGKCSCTDGNHQGIDCGTPFIQCSLVNGNLCNSAGPCNNVTGICDCTDGKHQGNDCSIPYLECPSINNQDCSGFGQCNNQTGHCTCVTGRVLLDCTGIDCTPPDCSLNGICNTLIGMCNCYEDLWYGSDCMSPYQYITSVIPVSTQQGGEASIFGEFGKTHTDLYIQLGDNINYTITYISDNLLNFTVPPGGSGIKDINVFQNGILYTGIKLFKFIDLTSIKQCPNQCSSLSNPGNGQCSTTTGDCLCNTGFDSFDCSSLPYDGNSSLTPPKSTVSIDQTTGIPSIINELTNFEINIYSVKEIDSTGFAIRQFLLSNKWIVDEQSNSVSQKLTGSSYIKAIVTTAGTNEGSIELSISITNYPYSSYLNTLQLTIVSTANEFDDSPCNLKNTTLEIYNTSTVDDGRMYIKISKNEKIYSGRFNSIIESDSRPTYLNNINAIKQPENSILVSMSLPHCVKECLVTSDFTLYTSLDYKICSVKSINNKWKTPVIAVSVVVGVVSIASAIFYKYKKGALPSLSSASSLKSPSSPLKNRAISLKNRLTNSKVDLFMDDDKQ